MDEKQIEEWNNAISKLSEADQVEIAGGRTITDEQCAKIQQNLFNPALVAYGGPGWWDDDTKKPFIKLPIEKTAEDPAKDTPNE